MENIPGIVFIALMALTAALTVLAILMPLWVWCIHRTLLRIERLAKPLNQTSAGSPNPIRRTLS